MIRKGNLLGSRGRGTTPVSTENQLEVVSRYPQLGISVPWAHSRELAALGCRRAGQTQRKQGPGALEPGAKPSGLPCSRMPFFSSTAPGTWADFFLCPWRENTLPLMGLIVATTRLPHCSKVATGSSCKSDVAVFQNTSSPESRRGTGSPMSSSVSPRPPPSSPP